MYTLKLKEMHETFTDESYKNKQTTKTCSTVECLTVKKLEERKTN